MRSRSRNRATALAAALSAVALSACGLAGGVSEPTPPTSARDAPTGRECRYASDPTALIRLSDLGRVGARGNIGLWGQGLGPADTVELSVRYADDGELQWVRTVRSTIPEERADALERLVFGALDETVHPDWGVRILVVGGDVADVTPSVICEPEVRLPATIPSGIGGDTRALSAYRRLVGRRISVRVTLDEAGRVMGARLVRSTQSQYIDEYIIDYVWNSVFEPKLHDGMGVVTTFEIDIHFPRRRR